MNGCILQSPIKLFRMVILPFVLKNFYILILLGYFQCSVGGIAVDNKNFLRDGGYIVQAAADVDFLVVGEDDDREVEHYSLIIIILR